MAAEAEGLNYQQIPGHLKAEFAERHPTQARDAAIAEEQRLLALMTAEADKAEAKKLERWELIRRRPRR